MPVNNFSDSWRAEFRIVDGGIYATVFSRFHSDAETIEGVYERCALVGSVESQHGQLSAARWNLVSTERSTTIERTDLGLQADNHDELLGRLNAKFGQDQHFIDTLL